MSAYPVYYYDKDKKNEHEYTVVNITNNLVNYTFLSTISRNKHLLSRREIERAEKACCIQEILGWPSTQDFQRIVANNLVSNCDVTVDDIKRAVAIYGEPIPILKGKMTRKSPDSHGEFVKLPLPEVY